MVMNRRKLAELLIVMLIVGRGFMFLGEHVWAMLFVVGYTIWGIAFFSSVFYIFKYKAVIDPKWWDEE